MAITICLLLALSGVTQASTFHGDSARTGNFSDYGPKTGQLVYRVALNPIHGSPVVANGTVFVVADYSWGGDNSRTGLYAVNSTNGTVLWHYGGIYGMSTPAVYGDYVFVHAYNERSGGGELMSFFASNGTLGWNVSVDPSASSWVVSSSPLIYNGSIYVLSYYGRLYKFDVNGNEIWNVTLGSVAKYNYMSSPSAWNRTIYVAVNDSGTYRLVAVDESGTELWNATLLGIPRATPVIYSGTVFLPTSERLYGFNATTGDEVWNVSFDGTLSTPAVADGRIYVANKTTIFCLDL
ncbi:outer membrane protein assembly factor BamB family protein, partial [Geoglobus sp.]